MFLAVLWGVSCWLSLSLRGVLSHQTLPFSSCWLPGCIFIIAVPSWSSLVTSLSCLQYLLHTDGHLCPTFPLAEVAVHVPSALPMAEMSSLILTGSFQPCPVSQLEFSWARASELFWTAIHLFCLHHLTRAFLGLCIRSQILSFPLQYIRLKSELYAELNLLPRVTFALVTVLTSCLTPWQTPLPHIRFFKGYLQRLFLLSVLSALPISLPLSCLTSETQLISFQCLSVSPTALIC